MANDMRSWLPHSAQLLEQLTAVSDFQARHTKALAAATAAGPTSHNPSSSTSPISGGDSNGDGDGAAAKTTGPRVIMAGLPGGKAIKLDHKAFRGFDAQEVKLIKAYYTPTVAPPSTPSPRPATAAGGGSGGGGGDGGGADDRKD